MKPKHKPRHWSDRQRLRLLRTIAARGDHDPPSPQWFSDSAWRTVHQLAAEGLLRIDRDAVQLTADGVSALKYTDELAGRMWLATGKG